MTEIPEHLLARARQARRKNEDEDEDKDSNTTQTVEVPVEKLELLKEWLDRGQNTPFDKNGINIVSTFQHLVSLIPEPAYEPDEDMVFELIVSTSLSVEEARQLLVDLHDAGLTITKRN